MAQFIVQKAAIGFTTQPGVNPAPQTDAISGNVDSEQPIIFTDVEVPDVPWLTVTPSSGTTPQTLTFSVDVTGMKPGIYTTNLVLNGHV